MINLLEYINLNDITYMQIIFSGSNLLTLKKLNTTQKYFLANNISLPASMAQQLDNIYHAEETFSCEQSELRELLKFLSPVIEAYIGSPPRIDAKTCLLDIYEMIVESRGAILPIKDLIGICPNILHVAIKTFPEKLESLFASGEANHLINKVGIRDDHSLSLVQTNPPLITAAQYAPWVIPYLLTIPGIEVDKLGSSHETALSHIIYNPVYDYAQNIQSLFSYIDTHEVNDSTVEEFFVRPIQSLTEHGASANTRSIFLMKPNLSFATGTYIPAPRPLLREAFLELKEELETHICLLENQKKIYEDEKESSSRIVERQKPGQHNDAHENGVKSSEIAIKAINLQIQIRKFLQNEENFARIKEYIDPSSERAQIDVDHYSTAQVTTGGAGAADVEEDLVESMHYDLSWDEQSTNMELFGAYALAGCTLEDFTKPEFS